MIDVGSGSPNQLLIIIIPNSYQGMIRKSFMKSMLN